jgi:hypothetical protein
MTKIKNEAESENEAMPTPKDIITTVHRYFQHNVLKDINSSTGYPNNYKYISIGGIGEPKRREIALLKLVRSPQFKAAIKNEYKKIKFKPKNIIRNIFGKRATLSPGRLKDI